MTFLFSSDFHSREPVFEAFARTLAQGSFDAGVLSGDLLDEWLPPEEVSRWGANDRDTPARRLQHALAAKQQHLRRVLESAGKPVFFVLGNHDVTPWPDTELLTNLHDRVVMFRGQKLVGYRYTRMDRYPHELEADLPALAAKVDDETVLVTHSPPWGVLDGVPGSRFHYGLRTLHHVPRPRWHLFGHVHECAGVQEHAVNGAWPALRQFFAVVAEGGHPPRPVVP